MRTLVITENCSLNGVISPMDGWFDPAAQDDELLSVMRTQREAADALVIGRVTYEEFAGYWPHLTDDPTGISAYLNGVQKYVVSGSLKHADWQNTTILRGGLTDELGALKNRPGGDIVVTGSASLARSLVPTGLVDVYRLFVYPVVQGYGRTLFPDGADAKLSVSTAQTFASGVVLLEYRAA
jgi:dihydrofolate reductase